MKRYTPWNGGEMIIDPKGDYVAVEDVRKMVHEIVEELRNIASMKSPGNEPGPSCSGDSPRPPFLR